MVSKKVKKKYFFVYFFQLGKTDMVLGKKVAIFDWNGAEIQPLEKGRKCPFISQFTRLLRGERYTRTVNRWASDLVSI